jgi:suppressor of ftsI/bilirubin oxidase
MARMLLHRAAPRSPARRRLLQGVSGACALALVRPSRSGESAPAEPVCGNGSRVQTLYQPGTSGYLGRIEAGSGALVLRAGPTGALPAGIEHGRLAFASERNGATFVNPTLVVRRGELLRVTLDNALDAATSVHWHGLTVDTANDGAGMPLVEPGRRYEYAFEVRNRGALYWYHPHPHGLTAGQVHDGLYGLLDVEDDDTIALRRELDLVPGGSELVLVLRDSAQRYERTPAQAIHGVYGDALFVNGTRCTQTDVATRLYRLRVVNACNARTLLLGLRTASGAAVPFDVIGNDGGLLPAAVRTRAAFLGTAERLDLLVDLRDAAIGDAIVLETRAFDPMHAEIAVPKDDPDAAHAHQATEAVADAHAAHGVSSWPEGAPRDILQLRVRTRVGYDRRVPARLSTPEAIDVANAQERPLRLGYKSGHWRINDRVFAMDETPIEVTRDSTEVWLLRNYFTSMPHAMHLHGFSFEVLERETSPDQVKALAIDARSRLPSDLGRKDTVLVWPGESVRVALRFALPFAGPQTYPFHCHNLEHEDGGMMLGVRVA